MIFFSQFMHEHSKAVNKKGNTASIFLTFVFKIGVTQMFYLLKFKNI